MAQLFKKSKLSQNPRELPPKNWTGG